jgi:NADH dehydrogenase
VPRHVVIAGGGFGGFYAAKQLERHAPFDVDITLVSDVNYLLYTPMLPGVAAGTLEPRHVVVPLRERLSRTELRVGWVTEGDPERRTIGVKLLDGETSELRYDHLIVSLGSISRSAPVPGLIEHGMGFKTIAEAIALRNRLVRHLELAEELEGDDLRREYLSFVFVGGGYAGAEAIAELQDFAADALARYPRCRATGARWTLVEAAPRIMGELPERLANAATDLLRSRGIDIRVNTQLTNVTDRSVTLSTGEEIPCRTLVWTAGVRANPVAERLGLPLEHGRIRCSERLEVEGHPYVWAIGDVASIPDPARPGQPSPPTAQHAIRQGKLVGRNVAAVLSGESPRPFTYKTLGAFADLGRHKAVANLMGVPTKGLIAWSIGRFYHLAWMPGVPRKWRLAADWTIEFLFPRDTSELGTLGHPAALEEHASAASEAA